MPSRFLLSALLFLCCAKTSPVRSSLDIGAPDTAVARVGGKVITAGQLGSHAKPKLIRIDEEYARAVRDTATATLDDLVDEQVIANKAAAEGTTVEKLLAREVEVKVPEPKEEELKKLYDETRDAGRFLPPFEQIKDQLITHRKEQVARDLRRRFVDGLRSTAQIELMLPPFLPPKVEVAADGPSRGDPKAPVTLVEFGNYECKFTGRGEGTTKQLLEKYKGKLRVVFRHFPFHKQVNADKAGMAALCAGDQGKFWEMHDKLFANQLALEPAKLKEYANELGLDTTKFEPCLQSAQKWKEIDVSREAGNLAGVTATPAFFINGRALTGARPMREFEEIIDQELKAAGQL